MPAHRLSKILAVTLSLCPPITPSFSSELLELPVGVPQKVSLQIGQILLYYLSRLLVSLLSFMSFFFWLDI